MEIQNTRIVFLGTSTYAEPVLRSLCDHKFNVVAVISQPDRRRGRNQKKAQPPVKKLALELGIEVFQPEKIRTREAFEKLVALKPDLMITASYGQILRKKHLELPPLGILNVHASLLPALRGAAPIQYSIIRGYQSTGVTIMKTDIGVDTGPILAIREVQIDPRDTAGTLETKLSHFGAELLIDTLKEYLSGNLQPYSQDESKSTHAPMLSSEDGRVDWTRSAIEIEQQIRGMNPCPGAFTVCHDQRLKLHFAKAIDCNEDSGFPPGTVLGVVKGKGITVMTGNGVLLIEELQPACKKRMPAYSLIQGRYVDIGYQFTFEGNEGLTPCQE